MRFIDSNIIAYAFYDNPVQDVCQKILREGGMINTINLIEAFNIIQSEINNEVAITSIKSLLKSNISIINVDVNLVFEALKRASRYKNLKFIDLLHYTTAVMNNCEAIMSFDKDFDKLELPRKEG